MRVVEPTGVDPIAYAERVRDFVAFLDDATPALFVADSISAVMRTDPSARIGTDRAVAIVAEWAAARTSTDGETVSTLCLRAVRKVVEAYRARLLDGVEPRAFYRPFVAGLAARCPEHERDTFRAGLRELVGRPADRPESEFESTAAVAVAGRRLRADDTVDTFARRLEAEPGMSDGAFDEVLAGLEAALPSRVGVPARATLIRLSHAAVAMFNTDRPARAAGVLRFVASRIAVFGFTPNERDDVRSAIPSERLDERVLLRWIAAPEVRSSALAVVRHFADLDPVPVLDRLEIEPSRDRRRLLLVVLELHAEAAVEPILERLGRLRTAPGSWYFPRNMLYVLSRIVLTDDDCRRTAANAVAPHATSAVPQLRTVALAALRRIGGRETVPALTRALDASNYTESSRPTLDRHLSLALEALAHTEVESGLAVVAEFATGARGAEFGLGRPLREAAAAVLDARGRLLPRRAVLAIVDYLREHSERRIKFAVGSVGADVPACRRFMKLVAGSTEPEVQAVLATPFFVRLAERATGDLASLAS